MSLSPLLSIAIILISGLLIGRLVKFIKLPNVTGYLLAGLLLGPYCFKILSEQTVQNMTIMSDIALGFIAFSIGSEFKMSYLKKVGATPMVIAIFEGLLASVFVIIILLAIGCDLSFALLLGAIASATAPAATIMVIKQYKAKGPLTETLLSVVAMDDAVALMAFGFAMAATKTILNPGETSLVMSILSPIYEIIGSILLGALLGILFIYPLKWFKKDSNRTIISVAFVLLGSSLAPLLHLSPLLLCMSMGAMLVNVSKSAGKIMKLTDNITPPIFLMFFVISGAELNISILGKIGLIGIAYVIFRVLGKYFGALLGAKIMKAPQVVQKYLGLSLVPQAGVAIGLSLIAANTIPEYGAEIRAVVLCATLIYELIGPAITKISLSKAGEIE